MLLPLIALSLSPALAPVPPQSTANNPLNAEPGIANFNYTYAEFDVCWVDPDYSGSDTEIGFQLLGSASVYRDLFVRASYLDSGGDADVSLFKIGAGWAFPIQERLDGYGILQLGRVDVGSADDTGWLLEGGVRYAATEKIELNGLIEVVDFEDTELGFGAGGRYSFTPQLSAGLNFETISDFANIFYLGLRYDF